MTISTITLNVAMAIASSSDKYMIEQFAHNASVNDYTMLTHYNFFYSYPEWGMKWKSDEACEFHRVEVKCHLCSHTPLRNTAGIGSIYVLNNGVSNDEEVYIKQWNMSKGKRIPQYDWKSKVPGSGRMILLCGKHIEGYFEWNKTPALPVKEYIQLELFV